MIAISLRFALIVVALWSAVGRTQAQCMSVLRRAAAEGKACVLVVGRAGCPYSPRAKALLESQPVRSGLTPDISACYSDVTVGDGVQLQDQIGAHSFPLLVIFSKSGEELWRGPVPDAAEDLVREIGSVTAGDITTSHLEHEFEQGTISGEQALMLAGNYERSRNSNRARELYEHLASDEKYAGTEVERQASIGIAKLLDGEARIRQLERHCARFPGDLEASINLTLSLLRSTDVDAVRREAQLIASVAALRESEASYEQDFVLTGYRFARQYALHTNHRLAPWAIPYTERALSLRFDKDVLVSLAELYLLANYSIGIEKTLALRAPVGTNIEAVLKDARTELAASN